MRWRWIAVAGLLGAGSFLAAACGLEQGGLWVDADAGLDSALRDSGGNDVVIDVPIPDVFVPPPCEALDASCLPSYPADAGWRPVSVPSTGACPSDPDAGWTTVTFRVDAGLVPGSCTCGCTATSAPCPPEGGVAAGYNGSCSDSPSNSVTLPVGVCVDQNGGGGHGIGSYPNPPPSTCDGSAGGDAQATSAPYTVCATSSCTADYCGLKAQGHKLCIINDGPVVACPAPYTQQIVGKGAGAACGACGCTTTTQARCVGTVKTYNGTGCNNNPVDVFGADGGCVSVGNFQSARLSVTQTNAACAAAPSPGAADLVGKVTVCCAP